MLSKKNKRLLNIIVWVAVGIAIIMMIISAIIDISENHRIAKEEFEQKKILENALKNINITKCNEYEDPVKCAILVAQKGGLKLCDAWLEDLEHKLICKAGASGNLSICEHPNLEKIWQNNCKDITESALRRIENDS